MIGSADSWSLCTPSYRWSTFASLVCSPPKFPRHLGPPSVAITVPFCYLVCCPGRRSLTKTGSSTQNSLVFVPGWQALYCNWVLTCRLTFGEVSDNLVYGICFKIKSARVWSVTLCGIFQYVVRKVVILCLMSNLVVGTSFFRWCFTFLTIFSSNPFETGWYDGGWYYSLAGTLQIPKKWTEAHCQILGLWVGNMSFKTSIVFWVVEDISLTSGHLLKASTNTKKYSLP